ncbi:MFS transporter [Pigmentiphaga soli]|uniref:MFS transporter n=1 Tax=Pigmentiphaga soli TaxID=1007095 RepID=A0ABP8HEK3_9BURK
MNDASAREAASSAGGPDTGATITVMCCGSFASSVAMRICDPMLPQFTASFHAATEQAALTVSAFSIAYGIMQLFYGPVGERFGKLQIVAWAALASTLACLACAAAPTLGWLVGARVAMGITTAAIVPLGMAWIGDAVPYAGRQVMLARFITGSVAGLIAGQAIGGVVTDFLGWRNGFLLLGFFYALAGTLLLGRIRHERAAGRTGDGRRPAAAFYAMVPALLKERWVRSMLAIGFLEGALAFGVLAFVPTFLHERFRAPLSVVGLVLVSYGVGGLAYTRLARRLVARLGERGLAIGGGLLLALAYAAMPWLPGQGWAVAAMFMAGLGFYMLHGTLQVNATQMAPQARGISTTLFVSVLFLGQSIGVACAARTIDTAGFSAVSTAAALGLAALGIAFACAVRQRPGQGATPRE